MTRTPLSAPIATLLIASMAVQPFTTWGQLAGGSTEAAANRELQRRMQREMRGREGVEAGREALRKKDWENAFASFKNAAEDIADAPATRASRQEAVDGLTKAGMRLAEQRVTEGYYATAVAALKEVLKHNPNDKAVLRLLSNIEAPDYFNKQMTPKHRAAIEEVKSDMIAAQGHKDLGRLDLAERRYEMALAKDKYNIAAKKGIQDVAERKGTAALAGAETSRAIAIWEVSKEWERPYRRFDRRIVEITQDTKSTVPGTVSITKKLNTIIIPKVSFNDTTIREAFEFLQQKAKSLDPAQEGVNIVLKLDDQGGGAAPAPAPPAAPPAGIPGLEGIPGAIPVPAAPVASGGSGTRITLSLSNVPLIEVIKYITNLANLKYKIEPVAVMIIPLGQDTSELFIKEWKVPPSLFKGGIGAGVGGGLSDPGGGAPIADPTVSGGGSALPQNIAAREFLSSNGVVFPGGAFAMFSPASSTLVVKNTPEQLDLVERIVEIAKTDVVKQIEIQAKFVEISQNNLKELSFDWLLGQANVPGISTNGLFFGGGTPGTGQATDPADFIFTRNGLPTGRHPISSGTRSGQLAISANAVDALLFGTQGASKLAPGIFSFVGNDTDPAFQVMVRGLDQKKGVDLLSAPRVTTKSGQRAVIEIIREFRYPLEFEQPQIPQTFGGGGGILGGGGGFGGGGIQGFPVTPTTPTTFETRNTGVTLEVEPVLGPDGFSIDMQLAPQVVEFEGFVNYGSPIQSTGTNLLGQPITQVITPNVINQPIFSTRKVNTNVTVFDGATVVLGGLIREDVQKVEDKVPFFGDVPLIGRLFRSNVDQHIKRNLVIFVSARLVNPYGDPIQDQDEKEEKVDDLPLPEIAPRALPELTGNLK